MSEEKKEETGSILIRAEGHRKASRRLYWKRKGIQLNRGIDQILDHTVLFGKKVDVYLLGVKIKGERKGSTKIDFSTKSIRGNRSLKQLVEAFDYIIFKTKEAGLRPECLSFQLVCAGVSEYLGIPKRTYYANKQCLVKTNYSQRVYNLAKAVYILIHETYQLRMEGSVDIPTEQNPTKRKVEVV
jgi:hypothetical protein